MSTAPIPLRVRRPGPGESPAPAGPIVADVALALAPAAEPKVRAYANLTLSCGFAVHKVRVVEATPGRLLVSMPSTKRCDRCPHCGRRTPLDDAYCGRCGARLEDPGSRMAAARLWSGETPPPGSGPGWCRLNYDVAHPCAEEARREVDAAVLGAYRQALRGGGPPR